MALAAGESIRLVERGEVLPRQPNTPMEEDTTQPEERGEILPPATSAQRNGDTSRNKQSPGRQARGELLPQQGKSRSPGQSSTGDTARQLLPQDAAAPRCP